MPIMLPVLPGESHPSAKLTDAKVRELRRRVAAGELIRDLAPEYGVSVTTIREVASGKRWSHIEGAVEVSSQPPGRGEEISRKLTASQVQAIRRRRKAGEPVNKLRQEYGVADSTIRAIIRRQHWKHVPE